MKFMLFALVSVMSLEVFAARVSTSLSSFCSNTQDPTYAKELTRDYRNLIPLYNQGGIINGGVCWWHSRFQRNALYLTRFSPDLDRPTDKQVKQIIRMIREGKELINIPGYRDFFEFSMVHYVDIQRELEGWQKKDAVRFAWVKGLQGNTSVKPEKMKELMDKTYEEVEINNNIVYQKLQMKGLVAHAWLVINMEKTSRGYDLEVLDSNYPLSTMSYRYVEGMTNFEHEEYGPFVPYTENGRELERLKEVIQSNCGG